MMVGSAAQYAVIFRAKISRRDEDYEASANRLRELALTEYGCLDFVSSSEGDEEVAISYWADEADIIAWKKNVEHRLAQSTARARWYRSYSVEVTRVVRSYRSSGT